MIDLYTWSTPNGRKISILLEELKVDYKVTSINIMKNEQFSESFLKISPNNKIPAIVDNENNISLMESGAIMFYLAEKYNKFLPSDPINKLKCIEWLSFQTGSQGPMLGQAHHFLKFNKGKSAYAEERYHKEAERLYKVMNNQLMKNRYLAGEEYTIADIAAWPWVARFEWHQIDLKKYEYVATWYTNISSREAVQKGYDVPAIGASIPKV
tara:strand:- start:22 stop:654 length:633 start_codon:yes stop_codon:yes gene_type:complete